MEIKQKDFLTAWNNKRLVAGALKSAHVRPNYQDYDDLLQEGVYLYAQMLTQYADLPRAKLDRLAFRKIIWHTTDQLRKAQRRDEHNKNPMNAKNTSQLFNWEDILVLQQVVEQMSTIECTLFTEHLLAGKTITELTAVCNLSRVQLQRSKRTLLNKLCIALKC